MIFKKMTLPHTDPKDTRYKKEDTRKEIYQSVYVIPMEIIRSTEKITVEIASVFSKVLDEIYISKFPDYTFH